MRLWPRRRPHRCYHCGAAATAEARARHRVIRFCWMCSHGAVETLQRWDAR